MVWLILPPYNNMFPRQWRRTDALVWSGVPSPRWCSPKIILPSLGWKIFLMINMTYPSFTHNIKALSFLSVHPFLFIFHISRCCMYFYHLKNQTIPKLIQFLLKMCHFKEDNWWFFWGYTAVLLKAKWSPRPLRKLVRLDFVCSGCMK